MLSALNLQWPAVRTIGFADPMLFHQRRHGVGLTTPVRSYASPPLQKPHDVMYVIVDTRPTIRVHRNPFKAQLNLLRQPTNQQSSIDGMQERSPSVGSGANDDDFYGNFGRWCPPESCRRRASIQQFSTGECTTCHVASAQVCNVHRMKALQFCSA